MSDSTQPSVSSFSAEVIAVGPKSSDKTYPITLRTSESQYYKLWDSRLLKRGTTVGVEEVVWDNGWIDRFIIG